MHWLFLNIFIVDAELRKQQNENQQDQTDSGVNSPAEEKKTDFAGANGATSGASAPSKRENGDVVRLTPKVAPPRPAGDDTTSKG